MVIVTIIIYIEECMVFLTNKLKEINLDGLEFMVYLLQSVYVRAN